MQNNWLYLPSPSTMGRMWHKVNFFAEAQMARIHCFSSSRLLPKPIKDQSALLFTHNRERGEVDAWLSQGY